MKLYHFSKSSEPLRRTDPANMSCECHAFWGGEIPVTFFFAEGSEKSPGQNFAGRDAYVGIVAKSRLYDATGKDALRFLSTVNRIEADAVVVNAGFDGAIIPVRGGKRVVILYVPTSVKPAGRVSPKGRFRLKA